MRSGFQSSWQFHGESGKIIKVFVLQRVVWNHSGKVVKAGLKGTILRVFSHLERDRGGIWWDQKVSPVKRSGERF